MSSPTEPPTSPSGLHVAGVSKSFGAGPVLNDVSIQVLPGEFVTLLGPSGCGKTTLLRIIAGLELADSGRVVLDGENITDLPAHRRQVNTVFQSYALFPHLSVHENVAFGLRSRRIAEAEISRRTAAALDLVRLGELGRRMPHQLSGGQKQRVALARALVNEPRVLLLDEPMSALDARLRSEVQIELRRIQRALGTTFILVTHDQDEAMTVSDRVMLMNGGRIVQSGQPRDVYDYPTTRFAAEFLGAANIVSGRHEQGSGVIRTDLGPLVAAHPPAWSEGAVSIRPERIAVSIVEPSINGIHVRVEEAVCRGDCFDLYVQPGSLRVRVSSGHAQMIPERGAEIWLSIPPAAVHPLTDQ